MDSSFEAPHLMLRRMGEMTVEDVIRGCYRAYIDKDRAALEQLIAKDFTFTRCEGGSGCTSARNESGKEIRPLVRSREELRQPCRLKSVNTLISYNEAHSTQ
jgi:ketosteroid isomerase-like protein